MTEDTRSDQQIVADLVQASPICMVTTVGPEGALLARPLTRQDREFDGTLHFLVPRDGTVVAEIHADPRANVTVQSKGGFVSVSGKAVELTDRSEVESRWSPVIAAFFPDGPETATVVQVDAESAEYWDSSGSSIAHIASFVKAAVTEDGKRPDLGEHGTVEL